MRPFLLQVLMSFLGAALALPILLLVIVVIGERIRTCTKCHLQQRAIT